MAGMWLRAAGGGRAVAALLGVALACGAVPAAATDGLAAPRSIATRKATDGPETGGRSEADALAEARRTGEPVEVSALRGESREVFATPGGDLEAREYLRPVWARMGGGWHRVDTDLVAGEDGMVAPKAATVDVQFSGGGATAPLVRMERAGRELSLSWPTVLPQPQLEGAVATYVSVLPDVDLQMTAQEDGFTQLLVVKTAQAAASDELTELRMQLSAEGLDVRSTQEGGLQALDVAAKGAVFEAPTPMMWDSGPADGGPATSFTKAPVKETSGAAAAQPGGAGEPGKLAPVKVAVPAGQDELVLTPDAGILRGDDTTYPVYIDPQWYSPRAAAWTMASKYWASSPQWKFNGAADAGLGFCDWSYCSPNDTKRLFYRIPVSTFAGKSILSAEFVVRNTWSASCSAREVELWQTKAISASTTWNSQKDSGFWVKQLASKSFAYGYSGCAAKDAEFDVKAAVQAAANAKEATMTFGLQAASETDGYSWKRFSDKAYLRVKYNRPPAQIKMSQLTMEYGGTCKKPADAARVRSLGKVYANNITDPDGDSVSVQLQAQWDAGDGKGLITRWSPARTSAKASGSNFSISLPSSIPQNTRVVWYARAYDGAQYSPWSTAGDPTGCYFFYDATVPKAPSVSSDEYPKSNPENPDDPWLDGVGKYGWFDVKAANSDVTKYWIGFNTDPTSKNTLTTAGGAAKTATFLPARAGLNFITAQAFDAAGNGSEVYTYQFRVKAGQPERSTWQMDEDDGAGAATASASPRTARLVGSASPGAAGVKDTAVSFDGVDDYAATDIPTVNTDTGFSVSAWAKLSKAPDTAAIIAAQPGNHAPGFELYYSKALDRWAFNQYTADTADASIARAMQPSAGGATVGKWTHLVGTLSTSAHELKLYVDGELVGTTVYSTPWDARRGLQIGAGIYSGTVKSFFPGAIDELQIFDKPVTAAEVTRLYDTKNLTSGRSARAVFAMDEAPDASELIGTPEIFDATYHGSPATGSTGVSGKAVTFDGTDDYADTGRPVLNNQRSFAVSAWAKLSKNKPAGGAVIAAQTGTFRPGFELYYSAAYDRWVFNQYTADTTDAGIVRAIQPAGTTARAGEWVHLAGVFDATADQLTLYVNGSPAGTATAARTWYAGGPVRIGATSLNGSTASFFPGQIDDVRLFDRAVSAEEVSQLFKQRPLVKSRWTFESTAGTSPVTVPDAAGTGNSLTLHTGATKSDSGFIDFGAMKLDGLTGYASAGSMPVDTSGSFTLTAWAQAAALPDSAVTLTSAEGSKRSAFTVRFMPDRADPENRPGSWQLTTSDTDAAVSGTVEVDNGAFYDAREWNHLALVYDGFAKQVRLYVNGQLEEMACPDTDGDGSSDDSACTHLVPWAENVLAFKATLLQVGRDGTGSAAGSYFPGLIDDVWAFQGALTDAQVAKLASTWFDVPTEVPGD
ncbi:LamG domain-containing protein [Streptomyces sp. SID3915]|uniref:LamG domain-containing protein n=1 Tax=Streptomyces sp. SID3915 TaxID=2690263 RepID=UPI00136E0F1F|nr:LamG domain-containing protein [Streptomyces sp. SID3915]MYX73736.1 DNRLRE domain-containing protein [Streptomyces sp. SID3915]